MTPDITHPVRLVVLRERVRVRKSMAAAAGDASLVDTSVGDLLDDMVIMMMLSGWCCLGERMILLVRVNAAAVPKLRKITMATIERKEAAFI